MAEFGKAFGNYPPGVTGAEPHLTGAYDCEHCGELVSRHEFTVGDHAVCAGCAAFCRECGCCHALVDADDCAPGVNGDGEPCKHVCADCREEVENG